ncbi:MAG: LacI family DNA-binding transcriptional regulator [Anaerolineae bacterium]|nr:LacI family DNA-binding transcriptional regulator [Anaerolineae bacterium]
MMKRATISDVAKRVGVSPTAVSFAFNNPSQLNAATVEQILAAARELGYAPNPHARALLSRRTGVLGVIVPQSLFAIYANPYFATFLQGIGSLCDDQALGLLTVSPLEGSLTSAIARAPVDGFIIVGLNENHDEVAPLRKRGIPVVIVDGHAHTTTSVNVDDEDGAYAAARHLLSHGHPHLTILTFEPVPLLEAHKASVGANRLQGYRRAVQEAGLEWAAQLVEPSISGVEDGEHCFLFLWEQGQRPTAVLCMSDAVAIGVVRAALQLGLRVPDDLEVIGFDDIPAANLITPSLSTVHQPIFEKGRTAAELLVARLEGDTPAETVVLATELVLRGTTR